MTHDLTPAELDAKIAELDAMPLFVYALRFGGLIVTEERLLAYKAEYRAKLVSLKG